METLYIRADANEIIGTGHVMRCLSIAGAAAKLGVKAVFIAADERGVKIAEERGYDCICLHSVWNDLEQEIEQLTGLVEKLNIRKLLVDTYYVTDRYLTEIRKVTEVTYVDDLNAFAYPVDRLLNYNFYGPDMQYACPEETEYLLGAAYAPLREEFMKVPARKYNGLKKILITSGGTDPYHVVDNFLETLLNQQAFAKCEFYCVLGRFQSDREALEAKYQSYENVHLLCNINNMGEYMQNCDAVVTAGGSTTYEICACGLPGVIYTLADNQLEIARSASDNGLLPWIGDVRTDMEGCKQKLLSELEALGSEEIWLAVSRKMQKTVDGQGAERCAKAILGM